MAKWIANPVEVDAFEILVVGDSDNDGSFYVAVTEREAFKITREMAARMKPKIGDYVVVQSDGYVYLNPKDVFERKYHRA
jgi:hypothetical protein